MRITPTDAVQLFILYPLLLISFASLISMAMGLLLKSFMKSNLNKDPFLKFVRVVISLCDLVFVLFSHPFLGWFARFMTTALASYGASEKLYEVIMSKPFYTPIDILGLLTAFMLWMYIVVVLIQAFYPRSNISEWVVIGCFSMFIGANFK